MDNYYKLRNGTTDKNVNYKEEKILGNRLPNSKQYEDEKFLEEDKKPVIIAKLVFSITAYLILLNLHKTISPYLQGILAQFHVLISIYLTIYLNRAGYISAIILNLIQLSLVVDNMISHRRIDALPGVIVSLVVILIVTILHRYSDNLSHKINKIINQKNELAVIYDKLKASEEELSKQNLLLAQNNKELAENAEKINKLAFYDSLTGIPNRIQIINQIELLSKTSKHCASPFILMMLHINDFKSINDTFGHTAGDQLLKTIVNQLMNTINKKDLLGRFSEEEFALIISRRIDKEELNLYINRIETALQSITSINNSKINISTSFGIAAYPKDTTDFMELIKYADTAMNKARTTGKDHILFFNNNIREEVIRKKEFENYLLSSIDNNELYLNFQPQYLSKGKELRGFEALVRWSSSVYGEIGPMQFIPIAEENGFIIPMGNWILHKACCLFQEFLNATDLKIKVSVNISAKQIMDPGFLDTVKSALAESGLAPEYLEIELTESIMIDEVDYVCGILKAVRNMGVRVALDDFGTGYSSLSLLPRLPIDTLKIDKSFIQDIEREEKKSQLIGAIISVAHKMKFFVIAEGIETENQLEFLQSHKCDCIQGYLWGKPCTLPTACSFSDHIYTGHTVKEKAV